jgi:hypothetical protein
LRLGFLRSVLWIVAYVALGWLIYGWRSFLGERLGDAVLLAPMLGLPGLVATGVRTRAWLSLLAAALSIDVLFLTWSSDGPLSHAVLLANFPYALVMLYGTKDIRGDRNL